MPRYRTRRRVIVLALIFLAPTIVSATCYWQNSTLAPDSQYSVAPDDTACFPDQANSPCCGTGWTCLSDGVCYIEQNGNPFYYRGTCTDRTWDSQQCPGWCFAQNSNESWPLIKCSTGGEDWYCCSGDDNCSCDTGKDAIKLGASQPSTITVVGSTSWPGYTSTTSLFTANPLVTDGTSTNTADTSSAAATSSGAAATTTNKSSSPTTGSAAAASATSSVASSSNSGGSNVGLAAGLGAGLGAAAVLIAGLVFFLIRSRRRHRNEKQAELGSKQSEVPGTQAGHDNSHGYHEVPAPGYAAGGYYPQKTELDGSRQHSELPGGIEHQRAEVEGANPPFRGASHENRAELEP